MVLNSNHLNDYLEVRLNAFIITRDNSSEQILAHKLGKFRIIVTQMSQSLTKLFLLIVVLHYELNHVWICEELVSLI